MPYLNQDLQEVTGRITAPFKRLVRSHGPWVRLGFKLGLSEQAANNH